MHSTAPSIAPAPGLRWLIYLPIGAGLLIITSLVGYGYYTGERLHEVESPLLNTIHEIKLEFTSTRFWIEEALDGEQPLDHNLAWGYLENSILFLKSLHESERKPALNFPAGGAADISVHIERLSSALAAWKVLSEHIDGQPQVRKASDFRVEMDSAASDFSKAVSEIETIILAELEKRKRLFRSIQAVLIGTCLLLAIGVAAAVRRYERDKSSNISRLAETNRLLGEEISRREALQAALAARERLFRSLFESAPDFIHLIDYNGAILLSNPAACRRLGLSKEEVAGRSLAEFLIQESRGRFTDQLSALRAEGELRAEYDLITRTGEVIPVDCSATAVANGGGSGFILLFQKDIVDRRRNELKLKTVHRFLVAANRHQELHPMLEDFLDIIVDATACEAAAVRVEDEAPAKAFLAMRGFDLRSCPADHVSDSRLCVHLLKNRINHANSGYTPSGSFYCNSASCGLEIVPGADACPVHQICGRPFYESFALIPINGLRGLIGLIHIAYRDKDRVSSEAVAMLEAAAMQLGAAIQRVRAEEALKGSHDELEQRVQERTEQLRVANERLQAEVLERSLTERSLVKHQERLRQLSSVLLQTEQRERQRIAKAIHDGIGQTLAAAKIKLGTLRSGTLPGAWEVQLDDVRGLISLAIEETRSLTFELSPPVLYEIGLQSAVEWMADRYQRKFGLPIRVEGDGVDRQLSIPYRVFAFQSVNELCFNAVKHAKASRVAVAILNDGEFMRISVADDGVGFDARDAGRSKEGMGFGLFSIREQLRLYGGALTLDSRPGSGTTVTLRLPLKNEG